LISIILLGLAIATLAIATALPQSDPQIIAKLDAEFESEVYDLFEKHCISCHSGDQPKASLDLGLLDGAAAVFDDPKTYTKVIQNIRSQVMPPAEGTSPTLAERERMVDWLNRALSKDGSQESPGKVTIRRLNKVEYNATLTDLLYIEGDFSRELPSDDVGYGFDNIGDVLSLTPLHIEMLLKAARLATEKAIEIPQPKLRIANLEKMRLTQGANINNEGFIGMFSNANAETDFEDLVPGDYELELELAATAIAVGPAQAVIRFNNVPTPTLEVKTSTPTKFKIPFDQRDRKLTVGIAFINDYYAPNDPDPQKRDRNLAIISVSLNGPLNTIASVGESQRKLIFTGPNSGKNHLIAAREVLDRFATRAYRRPVTSAESNRILDLYQSARKRSESYEQAIRIAMQGILVNPHFLFRLELDSNPKTGELTGNELASRLSFFLWNSIPDQTLLDLAAKGELNKPTILEQQVERMLADPKAHRFSRDFSTQWLQIERLNEHAADSNRFPGFDDALKQDLLKEVELYFLDSLQNSRPIDDFVFGKHTFLNFRLAKHYRIPGDFDQIWRRVEVSEHRRGGLLGMGAILTVTSNPNRTSPVKRGKFVMEQILGTAPPPPPPNVGVLPENAVIDSVVSIRQRLAKHRADPSCASCHRPLDAFGFALENFDAVGNWRILEAGVLVDSKGELPGKITLEGYDDLRKYLAGRKADFSRNLTEKVMTYALGRGITPSDEVLIKKIQPAIAKRGNSLKAIITEVVLSAPFRFRPVKKP
jgi:mono/diheme cytochrome c family protein